MTQQLRLAFPGEKQRRDGQRPGPYEDNPRFQAYPGSRQFRRNDFRNSVLSRVQIGFQRQGSLCRLLAKVAGMVLFQVAESAIQNIAKHRGLVKKLEIAFQRRQHEAFSASMTNWRTEPSFFQGIEVAATAGFLAKLFELGAQGA